MKYKVTAIMSECSTAEYIIDADSYTSDENGDFFFYKLISRGWFSMNEQAVFAISHKYLATIEMMK